MAASEFYPEHNNAAETALDKLRLEGVDVDRLSGYREIMERNKAPISEALFSLGYVKYGTEYIDKTINKWAKIQETYDKINMGELNDETGRDLIAAMKPLVDEISSLLQAYRQEVGSAIQSSGDLPEMPSQLESAKNRILELSYQYGQLPAYRVYKALSKINEARKE